MAPITWMLGPFEVAALTLHRVPRLDRPWDLLKNRLAFVSSINRAVLPFPTASSHFGCRQHASPYSHHCSCALAVPVWQNLLDCVCTSVHKGAGVLSVWTGWLQCQHGVSWTFLWLLRLTCGFCSTFSTSFSTWVGWTFWYVGPRRRFAEPSCSGLAI